MHGSEQTAPELPPELLNIIFAFLLVEKKQELKPCTLVCQTWRTYAQPYLFREVVYTMEDNNEDSHCVEDHRTALARIRTFFELRKDIAAYVHDLTLRIVPRFPRYDWFILPDTGYHEPTSLLGLLHLFPQLQHLSLQDIFVTPEVSLTDHISELVFPPLKSLMISSEQEEIPYSDIMRLLNLFTEVDALHLAVTCYFNWRRQESPCAPTRRLAVRSLTTHNSTHGHTLLHIAQTPSARTLHTVSLGDLEADSMSRVQDLLVATSQNLQCLRMSFRAFWDEIERTSPVVSLACCTALRRLELSVRSGIPDWKAAWHILATISADTTGALEDMAIEMSPLSSLPNDDYWVAIDDSVSQKCAALAPIHQTNQQYSLAKVYLDYKGCSQA